MIQLQKKALIDPLQPATTRYKIAIKLLQLTNSNDATFSGRLGSIQPSAFGIQPRKLLLAAGFRLLARTGTISAVIIAHVLSTTAQIVKELLPRKLRFPVYPWRLAGRGWSQKEDRHRKFTVTLL